MRLIMYKWFPLLIGLLLFVACDGGITLKGHVYSRTSINGKSGIFVDEQNDGRNTVLPLEDVQISIYLASSNENLETPENSKDLIMSKGTDKEGYFDMSRLTTPFPFEVRCVVKKSGYKTISKLFRHDKSEHNAIIILEADNSIALTPNK